jgi:AAA family ATP:ADP antiporter
VPLAFPPRPTGWFSYCAIESFGSIGVALFWAFVNATIDLEGAKRAYGLIIAGAQIGSILGPSLVTQVGVACTFYSSHPRFLSSCCPCHLPLSSCGLVK